MTSRFVGLGDVVIADAVSSLDPVTYGGLIRVFLVWVLGLFFVFILGGLVYWFGVGGLMVAIKSLLTVVLDLAGSSRVRFLGGSHLMVRALFLNLLFVRFMGLLPYFPNLRAYDRFAMVMAVPFWLGLVLSSVVWGNVGDSLVGLVKGFRWAVISVFFYWVDKVRILFRVFTLRTRFFLNTLLGQLVIIGWGLFGAHVYFVYFDSVFLWVVGVFFCVVVGGGFVVLEVGVALIQRYLLCMLLRVYADDHCL